MVIGILNFGEGSLALHYLIFCAVTSFGVLQFAAARSRLVGLMLFPPGASLWLGLALLVGGYAWFFTIEPDVLIPGLAGGEFTTLFAIGFGAALVLSLLLGFLAAHRPVFKLPFMRERLILAHGARAQLWLPSASTPPLVFALREASTDSLDTLAAHLVAGGAAVLLCDASAAAGALEFASRRAERFHSTRRYAVGVGRGADLALQLYARGEGNFRAVLALAPLGRVENAHAGLRWLGETDYVTALRVTWPGLAAAFPGREEPEGRAGALVVYGDEDMLVPPAAARELYPAALMVAGARHFTLAGMAAAIRLAEDWFETRAAAATERPAARPSARRGEIPE